LVPGRTFYVKSFVQIADNTTFGNVIQINSLNPGILSFTPEYALPGELMQIKGMNFSADTRVFFDDQEVSVEEIFFESHLIVKVPPIQENPSPTIRVISNGQEMVFERNFEYMLGKFTFIGFPERYRLVNSISFESEGKFYLGFGFDTDLNINPYLWEFDPIPGKWNPLDLGILPHISGFGTDGYFGGGFEAVPQGGMNIPNHKFRYWNGTELVRKAYLPFTANNSIAFLIKDNVYVLGGITEGIEDNKLYRFDPSADSWERLSDFPFSIQANLPFFVYRDKLYLITERKELIVFDPETGLRQIVGTYPGSSSNRLGIATVWGDRAIVGFYRQEVEIWELDLLDLSWKRKVNFPGVFQANNLGIYSKNNLIYLLRSTNLTVQEYGNMEFWEFDPDGF
jgi:hypothetical protein